MMKKETTYSTYCLIYLKTKRGGGANALKLFIMMLIFNNSQLLGQTWDGGGTVDDWDIADNWNPNTVPNSTSNVIITDAVVTVNYNAAVCANLTLNGTAQINFAGTNDVLSVYGDFDNQAGSLPVTGTGLLRFSGSTSKNIEGNAMTLNRISINKTSAYVYVETVKKNFKQN